MEWLQFLNLCISHRHLVWGNMFKGGISMSEEFPCEVRFNPYKDGFPLKIANNTFKFKI